MQLSLGLRRSFARSCCRVPGRRTAALEILINSPRIKKLILDGDTTNPRRDQSSRRRDADVQPGLVDLVKAGKVEEAEALRFSPNPTS